MNRRFLVVMMVLLALVGLMVSCKNDIEIREEFGPELVSVTFAEGSGASRGLSASLEDFNKNIENYYWGYAAKKSAKDTSQMRRGETPDYATKVVWLNVQNSEPAPGLPTNPIPGFSQGYWDFRLCAYKKVNTGTISEPVYDYVLVYQGETKEFLLKSSSTNESGNNVVTVTVNPVSLSNQNGTLIIKTTESDAIKLNKVDTDSEYGTNYFPRILSVESMADFPVEYVGTDAEKTKASVTADGVFSLPAGSYKVTFAFADSATAPTVNYAKGTIVATVYSNLDTTIKGDLSEMTTSVTIQPELNPELVTYTAVSGDIVPASDPTSSVTFSSTGVARKVEAKTTAAVTNQIIDDMATASGTTSGYDQKLKLNLNVETVEATEESATYEIGMTATLTSTKTSGTQIIDEKTSTSDVSSVAKYVTVTLDIQDGLTQVSAYHDGIAMMNLEGFELDNGWTVKTGVDGDNIVVKKVKTGENDVVITNALDTELGPFDTQNKGFYFYDSTGVIVFITKSFSPYSLSFKKPQQSDYVAEVGGYKYVTLEGAIKKAASKETITLLKNVTLSGNTKLNKEDVVLDLADFSIDAGEYKFKVTGKYTTVKNGTINTIEVEASDVTLDDLIVTAGAEVSGSGVEINGCNATGTSTKAAVSVTGSGDVTIDGGTYTAGTGAILSGKILVVDGNFKGSTLAPSQDSVSLTGGVYEYNVSDFVAKGYECAKVSESVYKVRKIYEARNVGKGIDYYFLQDAIDASSAGDVIEILININAEKSITVPAEKGLTIRLGETTELQTFIPHTITTNAKLGLVNDGSLTIDGTGSLINCYKVEGTYNDETNYPLAIENNGSLILDGCIVGCEYGRVVDNYGTLTIKNNAELKANNLTENNGWGDFLIHSVHGTVIVNSMVINNTTTAKGVFQITEGSTLTVENATIDIVCSCYLVDLRNGTNGKSTATIKNGTFKTTMKYYASGKLSDVSQQMFTFKDKVSSVDGSVLTIDGGTFIFNNSYCYTQGSTNYCPEYVTFQNVSSTSNLSTLVVNGGTFESIGKKDSETLLPTHLYYKPSSGSINVILSVGTFDVSADSYEGGLYPAYVLAAGSKKVFENKKLVVSKITPEDDPVARIGDGADALYFMTLKDAFDYNNVYGNGDTLEEGSYEGLTIVVLRSADITEKIPVNKNAYLDLGSFTLTNKVAGDGRFKVYDSTLIIAGDKDNNGKIVMDNNNSGWGYVDLRNSSGSSTGNEKLIVRNVSFDGGVNEAGFFAYRHDGQSMDFDHVTVTTPSSPLCDIRSIINGWNQQVKLRVTNSSFTYYSSNTTYGVFQAGIYNTDYYTLEDSTDVFMKDVTVKANYGPVLECHGTVTYSNCDFKVDAFTEEYFASAVCAALGGKTTVNNTNYDSTYGAYVWSSGGTINIESGAFKGSDAVLFAQTDTGSYPLAEAIINVSDGTYDGQIRAIGKAAIYISGGSFSNVSFDASAVSSGYDGIAISGGTFSINPCAYVVEGYKAVKDSEVWKVVQATGDEEIFVAGASYSGDRYMSFAEFRDSVNAGNNYSGCTVKLLRNIDLEGKEWTPIGTPTCKFSGTFNGQGHTIRNLKVSSGNAGLFDGLGPSTIKNIIFVNVNLNGEAAGAVCGYCYSGFGCTGHQNLENIIVESGTINATDNVGGLVAFCDIGMNITNCINYASVEGQAAGGIIGIIRDYSTTEKIVPLIKNCKNYGTVKNTRHDFGAGGIAFKTEGATIDSCENFGEVIGNPSSDIKEYNGGIVGVANAGSKVLNCTNHGNVSSSKHTHSRSGGIVGSYGNGTGTQFEYCINTGSITGTQGAGGIVGHCDTNNPPIKYCYNSGKIVANGTTSGDYKPAAGGLVGSNCNSTSSYPYYSLSIGEIECEEGVAAYPTSSPCGTGNYFYDSNDNLFKRVGTGEGSSEQVLDISAALGTLNTGLETPFWWGIDSSDGKIKPLSIIAANN